MDLWTAAKILVRRWYVTLPVLLLGIAATMATDARLDPTYQASGSVVLVPPAVSNVSLPYGGIRNTTEVLERRLLSTSVVVSLQAQGFSPRYTVENERDYPILNVVAEADTPALAAATVSQIFNEGTQQLARLQEDLGYPPDERIAVNVLVAPEGAATLNRARTRALFALGILTIAAAAIAALIVESVARRAWRSREYDLEVAPSPEWPPQRHVEPRPDDGRGTGGTSAAT